MAAAIPFPTVETKLEPDGARAPYKSKDILEVNRIREIELDGLDEIAGVFRGRELTRKEGRLTCGITPIDTLIGGGIVRGRISEIIGAASAGKTSLAAAFAAAATGRDEVVAWIDADGGLDPASTAAAGVDLARLLWVAMPLNRSGVGSRIAGEIECGRPTLSQISGEMARDHSGPPRVEPGRPYPSRIIEEMAQEALPVGRGGLGHEEMAREALLVSRGGAGYSGPPRMTERIEPDGQAQAGYRWSQARKRSPLATVLKAAEWILTAGGFGLVVIDCGSACNSGGPFTQSAALRLARAAERSGAAVIVIGPRRLCGTFAALSLRLKRTRSCFSKESRWAPELFDGLAVEAQVMRNKLGGAGVSASWQALADPSSIWMSAVTAASPTSISAPMPVSGAKPATAASRVREGSATSASALIRASGASSATAASGATAMDATSMSVPMRISEAKSAMAVSAAKTRAAAAFYSSNLSGRSNAGRRAGLR